MTPGKPCSWACAGEQGVCPLLPLLTAWGEREAGTEGPTGPGDRCSQKYRGALQAQEAEYGRGRGWDESPAWALGEPAERRIGAGHAGDSMVLRGLPGWSACSSSLLHPGGAQE